MSDIVRKEDEAAIAVVVVNWNAGPHLAHCLAGVLEQSLCPHRIIVVDNASNDGSIDHVAARFGRVEVVRLPANIGFAAANNRALQRVGDCDWVALLNPDAFPEPDWLAELIKAAGEHPQFAFFGSHLVDASDSGRVDGAGDVYHVSGLAWRSDHGLPAIRAAQSPEEIFAPCAAAALYRRDILLEVGGFDESYFCYHEDVDCGFRLRLRGYRCLYVPRAVVHHVGSANTVRGSDFSVYHGHRNLVWTYVKNMPWPLFWRYLPQALLLTCASWLRFAWRGQGGVLLKAKWDALRGLPRVWRQRREIQRSRRVSAQALASLLARHWLAPYLPLRPRRPARGERSAATSVNHGNRPARSQAESKPRS